MQLSHPFTHSIQPFQVYQSFLMSKAHSNLRWVCWSSSMNLEMAL